MEYLELLYASALEIKTRLGVKTTVINLVLLKPLGNRSTFMH